METIIIIVSISVVTFDTLKVRDRTVSSQVPSIASPRENQEQTFKCGIKLY